MSDMHDDLSSDDDYDHVQMPSAPIMMSKGRDDLQRAIAKMKEVPFGEEDGDFLSPIGSPAADSFSFGNRGKFQELKRKLEADQANRVKTVIADPIECNTSGKAVDIDTLLDILQPESELLDQSRMPSLTMRLDNHPKFTEMYRQIKERDHKILDLEARVNELGRQAVDMQDSLNQRDKLLNSKNEAFSAVNNKHRKELEQKEQDLRKTQQTMFDLEKNLSGIQDRFNHEKNRLTLDLEDYRKKIDVLQANAETMEGQSEALVAKAEVLEAEVSRLHAENESMGNTIADKNSLLLSKDTTIDEITESSAKLETTLKKLKMQFQVKLKAMKTKQAEMEEQLKDVEEAAVMKNKISELNNQVAELEEEKGHFLLQKIEYEEKLQSVQTDFTIEIDRLNAANLEGVEEIHQLRMALQEANELVKINAKEIVELQEAKDKSESCFKIQLEEIMMNNTKEIDVLKAEAEVSKAITFEYETLKEKLDQLQAENGAREEDLRNCISEMEFLKSEAAANKLENLEHDKLTEHFNQVNTEKVLLEEKLRNCIIEIQVLKDEMEANNNSFAFESDTLKEELSQLRTDKITVEEELRNRTKEMESLKIEADSSEALTLEHEALKQKLSLAQSSEEELRHQILELQSERLGNDKLKEVVSGIMAEKDELELILQGQIDELSREKTDIETRLKNELELVKSQLQEYQDELDSLKWEHEENIETCKQLSNEIQKLNAEKIDIQKEFEERIELELEETRGICAKLTATNKSLQDDIIRLEGEKQSTASQYSFELDFLKTELSNYREKYDAGVQELRNSTIEIQVLKDEIEANNNSFAFESDTLKEELSQLQTVKITVEEELRNRSKELESLKIEADSCKALTLEHEALKQKLSLAQSSEEELRHQILELQSERLGDNKLKEVTSGIMAEKDELELILQGQINELSREKTDIETRLKSELELVKSHLQECQDELNSLKWEHEENIETCKQLSNEIQKLNAEKVDIQKEFEERIELALEETRGICSKLTATNKSLQDDIIRLESEKQSTASQYSFELDFLKTELSNYSEKYEAVVEENERLQVEAKTSSATMKISKTVTDEKKAAVLDFVDWSEKEEVANVRKEDEGDDSWGNFGWGDTEVLEEPVSATKPFLTSNEENDMVTIYAEEKKQLEYDCRLQRMRIQALQDDYDKLDSKTESLENEIYRIETERDQLLEDLAAKDFEVKEKEGKVLELSGTIATLELTVKKLKAQFQTKLKLLKEKVAVSTPDERKSPDDRRSESPSLLRASPVKSDDDHQLSLLRGELNQVREEKLSLAIKLNSCESDLAQCSSELETMKWDYQSLEENCEVLNHEIKRLQALTECENSESNLRVDVESPLSSDKAEELARAQNTIVNLEVNLETTEKKLHDLEVEAQKLRTELLAWDNRHEEVCKEYEAKLDTLQKGYRDYQSKTEPTYVARIGELEQRLTLISSTPPVPANIHSSVLNQETETQMAELRHLLDEEQRGRNVLERKIELLQGKISEIEQSEMKCFEETLLLKSWTRELEIDNQKKQAELELYRNLGDGDGRNIKVTILQEEVMRLVNELQDRDSRCEGLTIDITQLLEERDALELRLGNTGPHSEPNVHSVKSKLDDVESPDLDALKLKLDELEERNYVMNMDLRRERESRRLVQEQLFFSQSTRGYGQQRNRSPLPSPNRTPSRPSIPLNVSSPALLPAQQSMGPPLVSKVTHSHSPSYSNPTPTKGPPSIVSLSAEQFQTVELDGNSSSSSSSPRAPLSPPSPVMRI